MDILHQDLTSQIGQVKHGGISAKELFQLQLDRAKTFNPTLNAYISLSADPEIPDNPLSTFAGVSLAIKDNIDVTGFNTTAGMATREHCFPSEDAFVIQALRQSGASIMGKLNMHEGALGATNDNVHFGKCHNPHRLGFTPGGSSGGSASAVAAALTPLALGTDTMGSTRIPASYCGVFGFKPSRGMVSNRGSVPCGHRMDTIGPLARSARDLTLAMRVMAKPDARWADSADFSNQAVPPVETGALLLVPENLDELGLESSVQLDFEANLQAFRDLGFNIQTFSFNNYDFGAARRSGLLICEADMRAEHAQAWVDHPEKFSDELRQMLAYVDRKNAEDVIVAHEVLDKAKTFAQQLFRKGHYLLMPTAPQRAFQFGEAVPANQADLTSFANQAELAAVSIPMLTEHKLPAGMQIVGPAGSDFSLLNIAERWQHHTEFAYQVPNIQTR